MVETLKQLQAAGKGKKVAGLSGETSLQKKRSLLQLSSSDATQLVVNHKKATGLSISNDGRR